MKLNKKMIIMLSSVVAVIFVIIIIMLIFAGGKSKVISYSALEDKIITAGEKYYSDHEDKLPENGTTSIDTSTLVSEGYLNDLSKYTKKDVTCTGKLYVTKNPSDYSYHASIDCGSSYKTKSFKDVVVKDIVTNGDGLYEELQINPDDNTTTHTVYVFKGEHVNNYIKVGDYYWRIVKVYENGEIAVLGVPELLRATWDNRFNVEFGNYRGINDYSVSRLKDTIEKEVIEDDSSFLRIKSLVTTHTACIGKRTKEDTSKDGSTECSTVLPDLYFSLLPVYDYMNASLDPNCKTALNDSCYNYNYLSNSNDEWWTITGVGDNTQNVYSVDSILKIDYASYSKGIRMLANLSSNVSYVSGTGTMEDPYIIK